MVIQERQAPGARRTLEHRKRGVVLAQGEQAVQRHAEGAAEDGPQAPAMLRTRVSPMWLVALGAVAGALGWA